MLKYLSVDQLRKIVVEAEQLNAKYSSREGRSITGEHLTRDQLIAYTNDENQLKWEVETLSYDARMELLALMWIGRGSEDHFDEALKQAHKNSNDGDVAYIVDKSRMLPTYLRNGLKRILESAKTSSVSSVAAFTSLSHSGGTPYPSSSSSAVASAHAFKNDNVDAGTGKQQAEHEPTRARSNDAAAGGEILDFQPN
jgi:hypothetical protein